MSCNPRPNQPAGDNAQETSKRGKENQKSGHTTLDSGNPASSQDHYGSEEQWPLPTWPVRLCHKCISMTSTVEGLRALSTPSGYTHHKFEDLFKSAKNGCVLCREIREHVTGRVDTQYSPLWHPWWVSICGSFTSIPSSDENHSDDPILELRNLDIAGMSRNGARQTFPLFGEPYEPRPRNKFDIFTDAQSPKWLHPNIVAGK
jgi:hypothetical protein